MSKIDAIEKVFGRCACSKCLQSPKLTQSRRILDVEPARKAPNVQKWSNQDEFWTLRRLKRLLTSKKEASKKNFGRCAGLKGSQCPKLTQSRRFLDIEHAEKPPNVQKCGSSKNCGWHYAERKEQNLYYREGFVK